MKTIKLLSLLLFFTAISLNAQPGKKQIIKEIKFENGTVILNKKLAFYYTKDGNNFSILNLDNKEIINGELTSVENGKFTSVINFVEQNKKFSNSEIVGRNDLFFKMLEYNVFTKRFKIDPLKLEEFFREFNEIK